MTPDNLDTLDVGSTLERLKGDRDFLLTLFGVFVEDLPNKLDALQQAAESGALEDLLRTAHSLKGACATIGAPAMREAAMDIEAAAREGDIETAKNKLPAIAELSRTLLDKLQQEINNG